MDDPLRVLRAIRFASRYHYTMDPELIKAGCSTEVKEALRKKISRERIGKELKGMFSKGPMYAFKLIHEMELSDIVFALPPDAGNKNQLLVLNESFVAKRFL